MERNGDLGEVKSCSIASHTQNKNMQNTKICPAGNRLVPLDQNDLTTINVKVKKEHLVFLAYVAPYSAHNSL